MHITANLSLSNYFILLENFLDSFFRHVGTKTKLDCFKISFSRDGKYPMQLQKIVNSVGGQLRTLALWICAFRSFDEYKDFLDQISKLHESLENLKIQFGVILQVANYLEFPQDPDYNQYEFLAKLQNLRNFRLELLEGSGQNERQMVYLSKSLAKLKNIDQIYFKFWRCSNLTPEAISVLVTNIASNIGSKVLSGFVLKYVMNDIPTEMNFDQIMEPVKLIKSHSVESEISIDNKLTYESLRSEFIKLTESPGIANRLINLTLVFYLIIEPLKRSKDFKIYPFLSSLKRLEWFCFTYRYPGDELDVDVIKGLSYLRNLREVYLNNTHDESTQTRNANAWQWINIIALNKGLHTLNCRNSVFNFNSRIKILQKYSSLFKAAKLQVES